jgi:hypothetical protein
MRRNSVTLDSGEDEPLLSVPFHDFANELQVGGRYRERHSCLYGVKWPIALINPPTLDRQECLSPPVHNTLANR